MRIYFGNLTVNVFHSTLCARTLSLGMNHRIGGELGPSLHEFDYFTLSLYEFVSKDTLTATTRKLILEKVLANV